MIGTSNSYLMWILSGGIEGGIHVTDVTNASLTGNVNIYCDRDILELHKRLFYVAPLNIIIIAYNLMSL